MRTPVDDSILISVHLPKTAGTSFEIALRSFFGETIFRDYQDIPINTPEIERKNAALSAAIRNSNEEFSGIRCIHGHFLPLKYILLASKRKMIFVTWMRHPVERILSHYYYWKKAYHPIKSPALLRKMVEEQWSLERFCLGPEVRNLYDQFLWCFPLRYFNFIGITEFYSEELAFFSRQILGFPLEELHTNVREQGVKYDIEPSLYHRIQEFHERDMWLYKRALELREQRLMSRTTNAH